MTLKTRLYELLESPESSKLSYWINILIYVLIILSIIILMLHTVKELNENAQYVFIFDLAQNIIMPIFIVEYILRVYAAGAREEYSGFKGRLRYMVSLYAIIDLIAILPYIMMGFDVNNAFVRSLRLLRVFRLFRLRKYAIFANIIKSIFISKKEEFIVLILYAVITIILLSFTVFDLEHAAQPKVFSNMFQTLWWAVATLTTVGYGDMYPITPVGKTITAVMSIIGIAFIAIPGGIFASEFIKVFAKRNNHTNNNEVCLKCGNTDIKESKNIVVYKDDEIQEFTHLFECQSCGNAWLTKEKT